MKLRWLLIVMCVAVSMIPIGIIGGFRGFEFATMFLMVLILFVTFCVSHAISYFISHPLEKLTRNIDKISKGNFDVDLEESEIYEINNLTQSLNRVMASLKLAIHKVGVKRGEIFEETMKAKEEVEEKYNHLLNTINEWVWEIDSKGVITQCSPKVIDVLGYEPKDVIGKDLISFLPKTGRKKIQTLLDHPKQSNQSLTTFEIPYIHKDRHIVSSLTHMFPLYNNQGNLTGYGGIDKIVFVQHKSKSEEKVPDFLPPSSSTVISYSLKKEPIPKKDIERDMDSLFLCDEQTRIIDCTTAMHELLGYTKEEFLTLTLVDFDLFETTESLKEKLRKAKKHGCVHMKTIHKRKDGTSLLVNEQIDYLQDKKLYQCFIKEEK